MKILHLSDFHYKSDKKGVAAQNMLVEKLLQSLQAVGPLDLFFFTGDLVFSGTNPQDFTSAYEDLLKKVGEQLSIPKSMVFMCAGNHDVDRKAISEPIKDFIRNTKEPEELTKIVEDDKDDVFGLSCKPTNNFHQFHKDFYRKGIEHEADDVNRLYSTHIRQLGKWKIGIVTINTAWCSSGNDDKENLYFPRTELEKAIETLSKAKVNWKILLLHHPLTDLREYNKIDLEDLIYSEFHLMFSGHLHKREDFIRLMQSEGIFGTYSHAAFTKKDEGKIGYTVLDIDLDTLEISIQRHILIMMKKIFSPSKK